MQRGPAIVDIMVEGGTCRRPGPSLSSRFGLVGMGRISGEMVWPGRTSVLLAIGPESCFYLSSIFEGNNKGLSIDFWFSITAARPWNGSNRR